MQKLFVLVRPHPDEPYRVTQEQIDAGQAWLKHREDSGLFDHVQEFVQTGGWVRVNIPPNLDGDDVFGWFEALWADYPLIDTIDWTVDLEVEKPGDGFNTLRAAVREQRPVT